jgi:hypothetical protein
LTADWRRRPPTRASPSKPFEAHLLPRRSQPLDLDRAGAQPTSGGLPDSLLTSHSSATTIITIPASTSVHCRVGRSVPRAWSRWAEVLVVVKPVTLVGWHRAGFRLFWRWRSRARGGQPRITAESRVPIRHLADENLHWGAIKIYGELKKLGFEVSERTVAWYLRPARGTAVTPASAGWLFLAITAR